MTGCHHRQNHTVHSLWRHLVKLWAIGVFTGCGSGEAIASIGIAANADIEAGGVVEAGLINPDYCAMRDIHWNGSPSVASGPTDGTSFWFQVPPEGDFETLPASFNISVTGAGLRSCGAGGSGGMQPWEILSQSHS